MFEKMKSLQKLFEPYFFDFVQSYIFWEQIFRNRLTAHGPEDLYS